MKKNIKRLMAFLCVLCMFITGEGGVLLNAAAAGLTAAQSSAVKPETPDKTDTSAVQTMLQPRLVRSGISDAPGSTVRTQVVTTADGNLYRVRVSWDKSAKIPDEADLDIKEITRLLDANYDTYIAMSRQLMGNDAEKITNATAFDITLKGRRSGRVYEPASEINVEFTLLSNNGDEIKLDIVHFTEEKIIAAPQIEAPAQTPEPAVTEQPEEPKAEEPKAEEPAVTEPTETEPTEPAEAEPTETETETENDSVGTPELVETETDGNKVRFKTDGFSVYVVMQTTLMQRITATDGKEYEITVKYGESSGIPKNAKLKVKEITDKYETYNEYVDKTAEALERDKKHFGFARAFDISIVNAKTGEHYQPNKDVTVTIKLLKETVEKTESYSVVHFPESLEKEEPESVDGIIIESASLAGEEPIDPENEKEPPVEKIEEEKEPAPPEVIECAVNEDAIEFAAGSFSIYVVVENQPVRTYRFVRDVAHESDGEKITAWTNEYTQYRQTLANGEELVRPSNPSEDGRVFEGWYEVAISGDTATVTGTEFSGWGTVSGIAPNTLDPVTGEILEVTHEEVVLAAKFTNEQVKVTYYDQNGAVIHSLYIDKNSTYKPNATAAEGYLSYTPIQNDENSYLVFKHWTVDPYGTAEAAGELTASGNIDLYPVVEPGHIIYFNSNGSAIGTSASYVGSLFVQPDSQPDVSDAAVRAKLIPKATGYVFAGWYIISDNTRNDNKYKVFNADGTLNTEGWNSLLTKTGDAGLTYDPTLYAHWTMETNPVSYTVVYYAQKSTCDWNVPARISYTDANGEEATDYEFVMADLTPRTAVPGTTVNRSTLGKTESELLNLVFTQANVGSTYLNDRIGFQLSTVNNKDYEIAPDGSTVLYVYFDRKTFELDFYIYNYSGSSSSWDNATTDNYVTSRGKKIATIKELYGKSIKDKFPIESNNSARNWDDVDKSTYQFIFAAQDIMPAANEVLKGNRTTGTGVSVNLYYLQVLDDEADRAKASNNNYKVSVTQKNGTYSYYEYKVGSDNHVYHMDRTVLHSFNFITMKEEFFPILGFDKNQTDTNPPFKWVLENGQWKEVGIGEGDAARPSNNSVSYDLFYTRNQWTVHLVDPMDHTQDRDVKFYFQEDINENDPKLAQFTITSDMEQKDKDYYWFYDAACTDPVDFSDLKMPNHEMTFYAGLKYSYYIKLYPDGGELLNGSGKSGNNYTTWFRMDKGEKFASDFSEIKRDYVAVDELTEGETYYVYKEYPYTEEHNKSQRYSVYTVATTEELGDASIQKYVYLPGIAYTLIGWFQVNVPSSCDTDAKVTEYVNNCAIPSSATPYDFYGNDVEGEIVLKAKWRPVSHFNIVYDAGEGIRVPVDREFYVLDAKAKIMSSVDQPVGKQFRGWQVKRGSTILSKVYQPNTLMEITEDKSTVAADGSRLITLVAKYDDKPFKDNYTADYKFMVPDGGVYKLEEQQTLSPGETLVRPQNPVRDGYTFTGWYTDEACTKQFNGFGRVTQPRDTMLYAGFIQTFTVTYYDAKKVNNQWVRGDNILTVDKYAVNQKLSTEKVSFDHDPDRYVEYWNVCSADGTKLSEAAYMTSATVINYPVTQNLILWPHLKEYETLRFNSNGGTYVAPVQIPTDASRWPSRPQEPTRPGYKFLGWFTTRLLKTKEVTDPVTGEVSEEIDREDEYDFDKPLSSVAGLTNNTLYAWWLPEGNTELKAPYKIVVWAQTSTGADDYELQKVIDCEGRIGSTVNLLTAYPSITSTSNLEGIDSERRPYFTFTTEAYAEYGKVSETEKIVEDDGSTVFNVYFHRTRYTFVFDLSSYSTSRIHYKGEPDGGFKNNEYRVTVWLDKEILNECPGVSSERSALSDKSKAYLEWNDSANSFNGWTKAGFSYIYTTFQVVADLEAIKVADESGTKTMVLTPSTLSNIVKAPVHYILDGEENPALTQERSFDSSLFTYYSTNTKNSGLYYIPRYSDNYSSKANLKSYDRTKYSFYDKFSAKTIEGFTPISTPNSSLEFNIDNGNHSYRVRYVEYQGAHTETKTTYSYSIDPEYSGYKFYVRDTGLIGGIIGGVTGSTGVSEVTLKQGNGTQGSWSLTYGNKTVSKGTTIYYTTNGRNIDYDSQADGRMSYDVFSSKVIVENKTTTEVTVNDNTAAKHLYFYYSRNVHKVHLKLSSSSASDWYTIEVPYGKLVSSAIEEAYKKETNPLVNPTTDKVNTIFDVWSESEDHAASFERTMPDYDLYLYATWKQIPVTVTTYGYDREGNPVDPSLSYTCEMPINTLLNAFNIADPKMEPGLSFEGWRLWENNSFGSYISINDPITRNIVIAPEIEDLRAIPVTYVLNGGSLKDGKTTITGTTAIEGSEGRFAESTIYFIGASARIIDGSADIEKFAAWNTKADGTGEDYYAGDLVKLGKPGLVLYAQYKKPREVSLVYHLNRQTDVNDSTKLAEGGFYYETTEADLSGDSVTVTFKNVDNYTSTGTDQFPNKVVMASRDEDNQSFGVKLEGYEFESWNTKADGTGLTVHPYDMIRVDTTGKDSEGELHLYARWTQKITVSYTVENKWFHEDGTQYELSKTDLWPEIKFTLYAIPRPSSTGPMGVPMDNSFTWPTYRADGSTALAPTSGLFRYGSNYYAVSASKTDATAEQLAGGPESPVFSENVVKFTGKVYTKHEMPATGFVKGDVYLDTVSGRYYIRTGGAATTAPTVSLTGWKSFSTSGAGASAINYTTEAEAVSLKERMEEQYGAKMHVVKQSETVTQYSLNYENGWTYTVDGLDPDYIYFAVENLVGSEDVAVLTDYPSVRYDPRYDYTMTKLTVSNRFDPIARVSADGTHWTYHDCMDIETIDDVYYGVSAFNMAKTLSGDITIETLRETATFNRYTLGTGVQFPNGINKITLRTTQDAHWNDGETKFRTTLTRGAANTGSMFTVKANKTLVTENIIIDGSNYSVSGSGGVMNVAKNGTLTINGGTKIQNAVVGSGKSGGAVYVEAGGTFGVNGTASNGVEFVGCSAGNGGGAINVNEGTNTSAFSDYTETVNIYYCTFTDCSAKGTTDGISAGGAVRCMAKTFKIDHCSFNRCTTVQQGGAVYHMKDSTTNGVNGTKFEALNCTFTECRAGISNTQAASGGLETQAMSVTIDGCSFTGCVSNKNAGAVNVYRNGSTINVKNTTFTGCKANGTGSEGNGGALRTTGNSTTVENCTFTNCEAKRRGGAIHCKTDTTIKGTTVINGCKAVDVGGGAIFLENGTLTINAGTITTCTAPDGGGVYQSGGTLNFAGGTITGCDATGTNGKGGGVFLGGTDSKLNLKGGTIQSCDGKSGGGVYQNSGTLTFSSGTVTGCTASANGGGVYLNSGTFTLSGGTISNSDAASYGGGAYIDGGSFTLSNGIIDNCDAKAGGGVYIKKTDSDKPVNITKNGDAITNCEAVTITKDSETGAVTRSYTSDNKGGGIYQGYGELNIKNSNAAIKGCKAYDGGGVYLAGTDTKMNIGEEDKTTGGSITGCEASHDGGGIYQNDGNLKIYNGSRISSNTADNGKGGGVYMGGGGFYISGSTPTVNENTASRGAGLFVANGAQAHIEGGSISGNKASTVNGGGGIAAGGTNSRLYFQGNIEVWGNKQNAKSGVTSVNWDGEQGKDWVWCNVLFDWDSTKSDSNQKTAENVSVINTTDVGLEETSHIGVYVVGEKLNANSLFGRHGDWGKPFGTFANEDNINRFINDRTTYYSFYYGVQNIEDANDTNIYWAEYFCKITDENRNLLFTNTDQTAPALYRYLGTGNERMEGAFEALGHKAFYDDKGNPATPKYVEMLVENYELKREDGVVVPSKEIILTTAQKTDNPELNHVYYKGPAGTRSVIMRGRCENDETMMTIGSGAKLTLTNIILDGESRSGVSVNGGIFNSAGDLILETGSTLRNSYTTGSGAAVYFNSETVSGSFTMKDGSSVTGCRAGNGGVIFANAGTVTVDISKGTITGCTAANGGFLGMDGGTVSVKGTITGSTATEKGGALYVAGGTFNADGDTIIESCSAAVGGAVYVGNDGTYNMTGGAIRSSTATDLGGAMLIAGTANITGGTITGNTSTNGGAINFDSGSHGKLYLSGNPYISGNGTRNVDIAKLVSTAEGDTILDKINVNGTLAADALIGVYASEANDFYGEFFGKYSTDAQQTFSVFKNDKYLTLFGMAGESGKLAWGTYICKIVETNGSAKTEHPFNSLNDAVTFARDHKSTLPMNGSSAVKIEMLVDYEIPSTDKVALDEATDNIIITTAPVSPTFTGETFLFSSTIKSFSSRESTDSTSTAILARGWDGEGTNENALFYVNNGSAKFATENIIFTGGKKTASTGYTGRAICNNAGAVTVDSGSIFRGFTTPANGGVIYLNAGTAVINNCEFYDFTASGNGGAIYNNSAAKVTDTDGTEYTVKISNSKFDGHNGIIGATTNNAVNGGVIYLNAGITVINNCEFYDFTADGSGDGSGYGGAIYNNSAAKTTETGGTEYTVKISDSVFDGHEGGVGATSKNAVSGGAIFNKKGDLRMIDCRILDCKSSGNGGAIYEDNTNVGVTDIDTVNLLRVTIDGHAGGLDWNTANANYGGAIYTKDQGATDKGGSLRMNGCELLDCVAAERGGAIFSESTRREAFPGQETKDEPTVHMIDTLIDGHDQRPDENNRLPTSVINAQRGGGILLGNGTLEVEGTGDGSNSVIRNCTAETYGGAIDSYGEGTQYKDKGAPWKNSDDDYTVVLKNTYITDCSAGTAGGAVNVKTMLTLYSARITDCSAGDRGGAINTYGGLNANTALTVINMDHVDSPSTIIRNTAARGAGIYMMSGTRLNLAGNQNFGGADVKGGTGDDKDDIMGVSGNFVTGTLTGETNGSKPYTKMRQDIYLAGTDANLTSITVTGELTGGEGTIWVGAADRGHYYMLKQFAVIKSGVTVTDATCKAFRNAHPDSVTDCGADYLTGKRGDETGDMNIYWTGGFDLSFLTIDGEGSGQNGAGFTLFTTYTESDGDNFGTVSDPAQRGGSDITADSQNGKLHDSDTETVDGATVFEKLPPKPYYFKETTVPEGYKNDKIYKVEFSSSGEPTVYVTATDEDGNVIKENGSTVWVEAPKNSDGTYLIMNTAIASRKVVLKKVKKPEEGSTKYNALAGAQFRVFRMDMTEYTKGQPVYKTGDTLPEGKNVGDSKGYFQSETTKSGIWFTATLPYGKYYLVEIKAPEGVAVTNAGKIFELTVNKDGVTVPEAPVKQVNAGTESQIVADFMTWAAAR